VSELARTITDVTCAAYDANADSYGPISEDYAKFPGLREEVTDFSLNAPPNLPVLDLGCGGGRDSRLLTSLGRKVIAGDYAPAMLRWAREQAADEHPPSFLRLDALALPFQERSLAGVWASGSLLHIPRHRMRLALAELHRVLAPGGITTISMRDGDGEGWIHGGSVDGHRWFTFISPHGFGDLLKAADFSDVHVRFAGRPGWFVASGMR
jgi:ubiquinone/menaquinone biosynthesis C-methylase UbiE